MSTDTIFCPTLPEAFARAAMPYPENGIEPGTIARFPTCDKPKDKAGWCTVFDDGAGAAFGDHRAGTEFLWQRRDSNAPPPTEQERQAVRDRIEQAKQQAERKHAAQYSAAAEQAAILWRDTCALDPAHEYVTRKKITPYAARQDKAGNIVLPVYSANGQLQSLQFIDAEGGKRFLFQAKMKGGRLCLGAPVNGEPLNLAEGWATACSIFEATSQTTFVGFSGCNLDDVAADLRRQYPASPLRIAGDLDAHGAGKKYADDAAVAGAPASAILPIFADGRDRGDFNDMHQAEGIDAVRAQLCGTPPMHYKMLTAADLFALPPMSWLLHGVLPREGLAILYGAPGSGKSFLALDLAACMAAGTPTWFGRRLAQCHVTIVVLEGECGFPKRAQAWEKHHGQPLPPGLHFIMQPFNFLNDDDVAKLAKAILAEGGANGMTVIDTLNRATPGADENSSVDMGNILAAAKRLQKMVGGLILAAHHPGKDLSKGLRGHSSLGGAIDAAIEVSKIDGRREWISGKVKDDESGIVHAFKLDVVTVGHDEYGDEITSCVIEADDSADTIKRTPMPSGINQQIAVNALAEPLSQSTEFGKDGAPALRPCLRLDDAVQLIAERLTCENKRRLLRARGALASLVAKGIFGVKGDWLWRI